MRLPGCALILLTSTGLAGCIIEPPSHRPPPPPPYERAPPPGDYRPPPRDYQGPPPRAY